MKSYKTIKDLAKFISSKNAKPYLQTIDIVFNDKVSYETVKKAKTINPDIISRLYKIDDKSTIKIYSLDTANAVKITFRRKIPSGSPGDTDIAGAQQHIPIYYIKVAENKLHKR